jgi:hypothetical protein
MVFAISYRDVDVGNARLAHLAVRLILLVFIVLCVFDPANQISAWKTPVFIALWIATLLSAVLFGADLGRLLELAIYVAVFVLIPVLSIILYYAIDGRQPFEGFALLKGYLLFSLALVLALNKIDLLPQLSAALTVLAICVIAVFAVLLLHPGLYDWMKAVADPTGVLVLDKRSYGKDITFLQVYFVTSPMLLIAIAYYFDRAITVTGVGDKLLYSSVVAVNIAGMVLGGTRNNIFASLLLPFLLWPIYTRRPVRYLLFSVGVAAVMALPFLNYFGAFFDPLEHANRIKLATFQDYFAVLSNPVTLLFGQGLGAYQTWTVKNFNYITELTYLEMLRNFGLLGTLPLLTLLLLPVENAFIQSGRQEHSLAIAWLLYLVVCFSNPNLFSSMGILILSALVANVFLRRDRGREPKRVVS